MTKKPKKIINLLSFEKSLRGYLWLEFSECGMAARLVGSKIKKEGQRKLTKI